MTRIADVMKKMKEEGRKPFMTLPDITVTYYEGPLMDDRVPLVCTAETAPVVHDQRDYSTTGVAPYTFRKVWGMPKEQPTYEPNVVEKKAKKPKGNEVISSRGARKIVSERNSGTHSPYGDSLSWQDRQAMS